MPAERIAGAVRPLAASWVRTTMTVNDMHIRSNGAPHQPTRAVRLVEGTPELTELLEKAYAGHGSSYRGEVIDSLLQGRHRNLQAIWLAANHLCLPAAGPYVVVAAEVSTVGSVALPEIESKLRSLDVYSAWRTLPDLQIGIAHVISPMHLQRMVALLTRMSAKHCCVGVSAPFDDLQDCADALHFAKVAMRSMSRQPPAVAVFDGSVLATAAASAPELMVKSVRPILERFDELPEDDRALLFRTFHVWQETGGSFRATAELLACHTNTVRHRIRRIEQRTGRSLARPRDLAELCLAFEVRRCLLEEWVS
ncbi:hypothetical protein ABIA30_004024 [Mycobacterium sp. MAA66]|uniref:PucR family transcriptional regulator n=1 Tax=Mycobacterium sp. MAA66 TaxID=3156297 RepID=UPI0035158FFB